MGEATDFKFGRNIQSVHPIPNQSPLNILEKRERGRVQGLPNFFGYFLLSQERVKLRTSNFLDIFIVSIGRSPLKLSVNVAAGGPTWASDGDPGRLRYACLRLCWRPMLSWTAWTCVWMLNAVPSALFQFCMICSITSRFCYVYSFSSWLAMLCFPFEKPLLNVRLCL